MKIRWFGPTIMVMATGLSLWALPRLPPMVATHWNAFGEPDGHSSRLVAVLLIPGVMLAMLGLFAVLPRIDPKRANYARFQNAYWLLANGVVAFFGLVHVLVVGSGLGLPVSFRRLLPLGVGGLLLLVGRFLGRVEPNWFMGVRTPWTLSSDQVWRTTHRTAGRLFMGGGLVAMALAVVPRGVVTPLLILLVVTLGVVPVGQSYLLWRRERNSAG